MCESDCRGCSEGCGNTPKTITDDQLAEIEASRDMHGKIMNIQHDKIATAVPGALSSYYKHGHRDARHAAAEIALAGDAEIERLRSLLDASRQHIHKLRVIESTLFDAIKHGDEEHMDWLKRAIDCHFKGKDVPPASGRGDKEYLSAKVADLQSMIEAANVQLAEVMRERDAYKTNSERYEYISEFCDVIMPDGMYVADSGDIDAAIRSAK